MVANEGLKGNVMNDLLKIYASEVVQKVQCELQGDAKGAALHAEAADSIEKQIEAKLSNPYPDADEGYAPLPLSDREKLADMLSLYPAKPDSGLLEDGDS